MKEVTPDFVVGCRVFSDGDVEIRVSFEQKYQNIEELDVVECFHYQIGRLVKNEWVTIKQFFHYKYLPTIKEILEMDHDIDYLTVLLLTNRIG